MRAGFWEILLIVVLALVLFGHAKFPSMMKNLAEGIKVFKKEMKPEEKTKLKAQSKKPKAKSKK
jgi:sec-independent protein translocase protein TatA